MTHSFHRLRSIPARLVTAAAVVSALVAAAGTYPVAPSAATSASDTVARAGIAQVRTYTCKGRKLSQGTGFVIGKSVVMTTRRILNNACTAVVTVNGRSIVAKDWATLAAAGVKEAATDLATIRLSKAALGAHVFRIRAAGPAVGASVTVAGYPAGSGLVVRHGKLVWRGTKAGAPLLAAKVVGVTADDGAPLLDSAGLVTGIVQAGRAARDVPGSRAGVLEGLDLSRWWTPSARYDICQAYKGGGILNCPTREPAPTPEPTPTPTPTPAPTPSPVPETGPVPTPDPTPQPPRAPTDYAIASCWVQYTADSWDNVAAAKATATLSAADLVANGPGNHWSIVQLTDGAPADIKGVTASLISPTGFVSPGTPFDWGKDVETAGAALDWQVTTTGVWFFQNPLYPLPQQWTIRWSFPNGQSCGAAFTVTA